MRIRAVALGLLALALLPAPAAAWCDPDVCGVRTRPAAPAPAPLAADRAAALGLHAVTIVKTGDVVDRQGATTTYRTTTARVNAGTFAKKVASVGAGESTRFDAAAPGQRLANSAGVGVSGDWYANHACTGAGCTLIGFVFFANDSETRAAAAPPPPPSPVRAGPPPVALAPTAQPAIRPAAPSAPRVLAPSRVSAPVSAPRPAPRVPSADAPQRRPATVTAWIALSAQGDPVGSIEVLRGRHVELWLRATVDGQPERVSSWRLVSGEVTALGPTSGSGDRPLSARWDAPSARSAFLVRIDGEVLVPGEGSRAVSATLSVAVRSPGISE